MSRLKVGDRAPEFTAVTQDGTTIRLSDYAGKSGVVLFFYPMDNTPVCTKEACAFRDSYERFRQAGVEVIGVSVSSATIQRAFADQYKLSFPLVSDEKGSLRQTYGVSPTLGLIPKRVTFVIDKQGVIRLIFSALFASEEHIREAQKAVASMAASA